MKTGAGLAFICVGAILAFAVTANTSVFNLHTAGWVLMLIGVIGLLLPGRTYGWLRMRLLVRAAPTREPVTTDLPAAPPYVARNPGTSRMELGRPTLLDQEDDPIEEPYQDARSPRVPAATTEVVEDLYEER